MRACISIRIFAALPVVLAIACGPDRSGRVTQYPDRPLDYPDTATVDHVDDYHGVKVADPYRWLEEDNAAQTQAWVEAQNKVTHGYLEEIPARNAIKDRLEKLWNYERYDTPVKEGGRYFFRMNTGLQKHSVLYVVDALDGQPRVLIDPTEFAADGTIPMMAWAPSNDGKLVAYGLSDGGSDWQVWKIRDVQTGQDLPDEIRWVKFSGAAWTKDNTGLYYSRYPEPTSGQKVLEYHKLYFHRLGTPQSDDPIICESVEHKDWFFGGQVSEDGRYLVVIVSKGAEQKNRVHYKDLSDPDSKIVELIANFESSYNFIGNDGPLFYFDTDNSAPRGRIIAIDTRSPAAANWKEIVPQAAETLQGVALIDDRFITTYLKDARGQVKVFDMAGKFAREIKLPGLGTVGGFTGRRTDKESFYAYTSFTYPTTIYRYDTTKGASSVFRQPKVDFKPGDYETRQVFYKSKDGTKVPMFITHKRGLWKDGENPTYLYGYGGFNASITPNFSVPNLVWMEMGGVFAVANLRGGGEYGEEWHQAGTKLKKQNVFDDFIAAAEWLIANKYTRPERLAIGGGSNGGLLVGACITQRPDLFGAALPDVGVMDMLRFHKFTIGWAWVPDYGSSDNPDEFKALHAYSPLHNIEPGTKYPATLVTTADHDDRVVPGHSFKFAAAMQAAQAGEDPVLIRVQTRAGHGAGKPITIIIEEVADKWAFLVRNLGVGVPYTTTTTAAAN